MPTLLGREWRALAPGADSTTTPDRVDDDALWPRALGMSHEAAAHAVRTAALYGGAAVEVEHTPAGPVVRAVRPAYPPSNSAGAQRTQGSLAIDAEDPRNQKVIR